MSQPILFSPWARLTGLFGPAPPSVAILTSDTCACPPLVPFSIWYQKWAGGLPPPYPIILLALCTLSARTSSCHPLTLGRGGVCAWFHRSAVKLNILATAPGSWCRYCLAACHALSTSRSRAQCQRGSQVPTPGLGLPSLAVTAVPGLQPAPSGLNRQTLCWYQ